MDLHQLVHVVTVDRVKKHNNGWAQSLIDLSQFCSVEDGTEHQQLGEIPNEAIVKPFINCSRTCFLVSDENDEVIIVPFDPGPLESPPPTIETNPPRLHDVPSKVRIEMSGVPFSFHKFPSFFQNGRIRSIVATHGDSDISRVVLINLPSGTEYFELAAKYWYGIQFVRTPTSCTAMLYFLLS